MAIRLKFVVVFGCLVARLVASGNLAGQDREVLPPERRTNGEQTIRAFQSITRKAENSIVEIHAGSEIVALGTVVAPQWIVTKASELSGRRPVVQFPDGTTAEVQIRGEDDDLDLALLEVSARKLIPIPWAEDSRVELGEWVTAPAVTGSARAGVIGAPRRAVQRAGGALGIRLATDPSNNQSGARIVQVYSESAAESAGLEENDVIIALDDTSIDSTDRLIELVRQCNPGDTILLRLKRHGEELELQATLGYRAVFDRFDRNQMMSGKTSKRRTGFKEVIQHTVPLDPHLVGGPLLNLEGKAIGINIARVDRVTTYALPAELVQSALQRLSNP